MGVSFRIEYDPAGAAAATVEEAEGRGAECGAERLSTAGEDTMEDMEPLRCGDGRMCTTLLVLPAAGASEVE